MVVRAGLRAADGAHALELVERLSPRIPILATSLRDPGGIEVARRAYGLARDMSIVLLTRVDDMGLILDRFRAGALAFVRVDVARFDLLSLLRRALAGETVVDPSAASWPSGTIKIQVEHILDKLGSTDRAQAAVRAVELGIVHGDDGALAAAGDR